MWLSLVEHCVRDAGVGGSNPLTPTIFTATLRCFPKSLFSRSGALLEQKRREDPICNSSAAYEFGLYAKHWKKPMGNYSFQSEPALFNRVEIGSYLYITVMKGALGLEWVDNDLIEAERK